MILFDLFRRAWRNAKSEAAFRKKTGSALPQNAIVLGLENLSCGTGFSAGPNLEIYCQSSSNHSSQIKIGDNVKMNSNVVLNADYGKIEIGNDVLIAHGVIMRAANHIFDDRSRTIQSQGHKSGTIAIEDDVWLGAAVTILPDVRIGKGSVIGAGSVVTKNIPPYSIAVGVPAKVIKSR